MSKVSIIITCYNLGAYLEEALHSALAQSYPEFEVVLVDDGSTDPATVALLDRLPAHPRLRILRTPNQGLALARNYGITEATGSYILPLDADDRILPGYLARAAEVLEQHPEVGFVGCHYRTFGEYEREHRPDSYRLPGLLVDNVVPVTSMFRRSCWEQLGGYALNMRGIEDWDLWIGILEQGHDAKVLPEIFFEYRIRPDSMLTNTRHPEIFKQRMTAMYERHLKLYEAHLQAVLVGKDVQFAVLLNHSHWLEQQRSSWKQEAERRLAIIGTMDKRSGAAVRRGMWWKQQVERWQRVQRENRSLIGRARALAAGVARVVRRRYKRYIRDVAQFARKNVQAISVGALRPAPSVEKPELSLGISKKIPVDMGRALGEAQTILVHSVPPVPNGVAQADEHRQISANATVGLLVNNTITIEDYYPINTRSAIRTWQAFSSKNPRNSRAWNARLQTRFGVIPALFTAIAAHPEGSRSEAADRAGVDQWFLPRPGLVELVWSDINATAQAVLGDRLR
jgi:glycosyltransferase involved in cell wall biosynthesis